MDIAKILMPTFTGLMAATVGLFNDMSPYLVFGFLAAGLLKVFLREDLVARHLGTHDFKSIIKASLFGIPLPVCSCGVIPMMLGLRKQGASKAALCSFMISTPTTGVDSILATFALLGVFFAVFRVLATFLVAMIVGMASLLVPDIRRHDEKEGSGAEPGACCCEGKPSAGKACGSTHAAGMGEKLRQALQYGFYDLLKDSGRSIVLGVFIGGAITYFVPASLVENYLGNPWLSMLIMLIIGIPMYVCSTGSIPVVAALMMKGLNPGAAFVFLITGPATNAVSFAVMAREFGIKSMLIFMVSLALSALAMGALFNTAWGLWGVPGAVFMPPHHMTGFPVWINYISSVVMAGCIFLSWNRLRT
ncbi:MAG: SO_0444 family Cu/Zn efflux transporter [Candidatus Omnitrophota bacterium]